MGTAVVVDGALVPADGALSALDRGALLGDAAFEVVRVYAGTPFMLDAHLARLRSSLARLAFEASPESAVLERDVRLALEASGEGDAYLRIAVTRGDGLGLAVPAPGHRRVVLAAPLLLPQVEVYDQGVAAIVVASPFEAGALRAGGAKTTSYVEHVLATHEARREGAFEAIFMAPTGQILEGASSNVFVVHEGRIRTPPASTGILAGITRGAVLAHARSLGLDADEGLVTLTTLRAADEIVLTSSIRELVPVTTLDGIPLRPPGPVYRALRARYAEAVAEARRASNPRSD